MEGLAKLSHEQEKKLQQENKKKYLAAQRKYVDQMFKCFPVWSQNGKTFNSRSHSKMKK